MTVTIKDLYDDPKNFVSLGSEALFALDVEEVRNIQLHHFRQRFAQMRERLGALQRLSEDVGIDAVSGVEDLASLAFPHTMYKSYSIADVEAGRYDRLTRFLQSLTTHNLGGVDMGGCASVDDWMQRLETHTPLRPALSSGTSGKMSIFPRSTAEEPFFLEHVLRIYDDPYRDEDSIDMRSGKIPYVCPWPCDKGNQNMPIIFRLLRDNIYPGRPEMVTTLGEGTLSAEELWLSGKLRRAEALGEHPVLSERQRALAVEITGRAKDSHRRWDRFIERAVIAHRGKSVIALTPWVLAYQLAMACQERGVKIEWAANSLMLVGGGTKGFNFPKNWMEVINATYPFQYPQRMKEAFNMTELTAVSIRCSQGNMHPMPWGIQLLVDPDTGAPLPRTGIQKGRLLVFDLVATTYWAGTASGDEVTIHWDGGCGCGRKGHYLENNITRLAEARGGDDKISCAKTPQAYDRLQEYLSG